jgi:hypothetical protein
MTKFKWSKQAENKDAIHQPGPKTVKAGYEKDHEKARNLSLAESAGTQREKIGILEWWNGGRMGKEEHRRQESVDRSQNEGRILDP